MKKICPKCNCEWEGYHDESPTNHLCREHWRIIIADTECPFLVKGDEQKVGKNVFFCGKRTDPEDNPYCSFTNCLIREV